MRTVVVDIAREQQALRRGGNQLFVTLDTAAEGLAGTENVVLGVHEALGAIDPRLVRVVDMQYFVGLDTDDIAEALGVSTRTVDRDGERARSFLYEALKSR